MNGTLYEKFKAAGLLAPTIADRPNASSGAIPPIDAEANDLILRTNRTLVRLILEEHGCQYPESEIVKRICHEPFSLREYAQPIMAKATELASGLRSTIWRY